MPPNPLPPTLCETADLLLAELAKDTSPPPIDPSEAMGRVAMQGIRYRRVERAYEFLVRIGMLEVQDDA